MIQPQWKAQLYKYISGIIQHYGHKVLAIDGVSDHIHILFGMRPTQSLSDLMQDIKGSSSKWINDNRLVNRRFEWQSGYGAFAVERFRVDNVMKYIRNQEVHHNEVTFADEYREMLKTNEVDYDERYIFQPAQ